MFVFYDTETTGTSTRFDQILQFAAILTDDDLKECDRYQVRCRLLPHIVPSPSALLANRLTPRLLTDKALLSHYEATPKILAKLREWSPAIFIGYNSIHFDEELLRQAFFQTLHPLYITNTGGNARGDLMRVLYAASFYYPESVVIPQGGGGRGQSYKLGDVAAANRYPPGKLHEAMADVEASIFLARHIKNRAPQVWEAMRDRAYKEKVIDLITNEKLLSLTDFYFGNPYTWLVTYCGRNPDRDSQVAVFDLAYDPKNYLELPVEKLIEVLNKRPKVIRSVRANAQPIFMPADLAPRSIGARTLGGDELQRRVRVIRQNRDFQERVGQALSGRYPQKEPSPHVEERIYNEFPSAADLRTIDRFHRRDWSERPMFAGRLADERLKELAERLVYIEHPEVLPKRDRSRMDGWLQDRIHATVDVPWTTVPKALRGVADLLRTCAGPDATLLKELRVFLEEL